MRRPLAWIRFMFERTLLRGLQYRLMLAVAVVATVAVGGGALVVLFDPSISQWDEGVWWAFLRLTDPGYLGDDEGLVRRFVSTVVTVLGYLLFLGLFIAILTQWLERTISKVESGVTPVVLSNHVIILGWTQRTPTIVSELLRTGPRAQRFLERHGTRTLRVVVLAEHVDGELIRELRER
ncbi:MAG: ion channel DMI1, partial [Gammaproteobacteria bacterium]|nr:ion channel DMI1 [Gammaproteobacteria bacterium]